MKILFLDDMDHRHTYVRHAIDKKHQITQCHNVTQAKEKLNDKFDVIMLDCDLHDDHYMGIKNENTPENGVDLVQYILDQKLQLPTIFVHSLNATEAPRMVDMLMQAGYSAHLVPFGSTAFKTVIKTINAT